nr:spidroin-1 [Aegilops tauschii subsp. strangulata]
MIGTRETISVWKSRHSRHQIFELFVVSYLPFQRNTRKNFTLEVFIRITRSTNQRGREALAGGPASAGNGGGQRRWGSRARHGVAGNAGRGQRARPPQGAGAGQRERGDASCTAEQSSSGRQRWTAAMRARPRARPATTGVGCTCGGCTCMGVVGGASSGNSLRSSGAFERHRRSRTSCSRWCGRGRREASRTRPDEGGAAVSSTRGDGERGRARRGTGEGSRRGDAASGSGRDPEEQRPMARGAAGAAEEQQCSSRSNVEQAVAAAAQARTYVVARAPTMVTTDDHGSGGKRHRSKGQSGGIGREAHREAHRWPARG